MTKKQKLKSKIPVIRADRLSYQYYRSGDEDKPTPANTEKQSFLQRIDLGFWIVLTLIICGVFLVPKGLQLTNQTNKKPGFNKNAQSITDATSRWVVVDKRRPLNPLNYSPSDLSVIGNGQYMRAEAAQAFTGMLQAAQANGYTLFAESGYRSYDTQAATYDSEVRGFGQTQADTESARPGYSEHQTGWAVDIASPDCLEDCFGRTAASGWLLANAPKFGFIHRYPADKSAITGYRNEPWHFRYVGIVLATELAKTGQTLEEFFNLSAAPSY